MSAWYKTTVSDERRPAHALTPTSYRMDVTLPEKSLDEMPAPHTCVNGCGRTAFPLLSLCLLCQAHEDRQQWFDRAITGYLSQGEEAT